jgi:hypothetical protein
LRKDEGKIRHGASRLISLIKNGIIWGVGLATVYSAWVTVLRVLSGSGAFDALGTSWLRTVALYYLGGTAGGATVGVLWFLRKTPLGAFVLGTCAVLPIFTIGLAAKPDLDWIRALGFSILPSCVVGGVNGYLLWRGDRADRSRQ